MKFLLKYASRSRPKLFQKRVENWIRFSSKKHELYWLCSFDEDDTTMNNPSIQKWCNDHGLHFYYGGSHNKIEAINANMDRAPAEWDVAIIVSDDMAATARGWDAIVAHDMQLYFPDLNGALWYLDGRQNDTCTLSIMGRRVYDELGHLYHPAFKTAYCDNYFHDLMERSGRLHRVDAPVFRHAWGLENNDALMRRNEDHDTYEADRLTYERLRAALPAR